jgi:hypothetical protein
MSLMKWYVLNAVAITYQLICFLMFGKKGGTLTIHIIGVMSATVVSMISVT